MGDLISGLITKINNGSGFTLSIVGMLVVFIGLLSLFISMQILARVIREINGFGLRRSKKIFSQKKAELLAEAINMEEVSAAIGLAFHLQKIRHSSYKITIKRLARSSWKESLRAKAMERL